MLRRTICVFPRYTVPKGLDAKSLFGYNLVLERVFTADPISIAVVEESATGKTTEHTFADLQRDVLLVANDLYDMRAGLAAGSELETPPVAEVAKFFQKPRDPKHFSWFSRDAQDGEPALQDDNGVYNNAILCKPGYHYTCALLASWAMNLMAVPLCHSHKFHTEMAHVFRDSRSTTMCADAVMYHGALPAKQFDKLLHKKLHEDVQGAFDKQNTAGKKDGDDKNGIVSTEDAPFTIRSVLEVGSALWVEDNRRLPSTVGETTTEEFHTDLSFADQLRRHIHHEWVSSQQLREQALDPLPPIPEPERRTVTELVESEDEVIEVPLNPVLRARLDAAQGSKSATAGPLSERPTINDDALMIYTSGTTNKPKGVVHTHKSISNQVDVLLHAWKWESTDRILNVLPMHHVHGLVNVLLCSLAINATCVFRPFQGGLPLARRLSEGDLTVFMGVPAIYAKLVDEANRNLSKMELRRLMDRTSDFRLMVSGSAALPVPVLEDVEKLTGQRLLERYGMTEVGMALSQPYRPVDGRVPGSVGGPLPTVEALLVSETPKEGAEEANEGESSSALAEYDQVGSLMLRSGSLFDRYWGNPEATKKETWVDTEGSGLTYFNTGDTVGARAVEIAGTEVSVMSILGRSSVDIIKHNGFKLSALEIEAALLATGLFAEVAVVGVPHKTSGESVVALVAVSDDVREALKDIDQREQIEQSWYDTVAEGLTRYKCPSKYVVLPGAMPRNAMGKINKKELKKAYL